jgi:hypothetical protein
MEYSVDGREFRVFPDGVTLRTAGARKVRARGVGADGVEGDVVEFIVEVDARPPSVDVHLADPVGQEGTSTVTISASDDTKVACINVAVDGGPPIEYVEPLKLDATRSVSLSVWATDIVGNVSPQRTLSLSGRKSKEKAQ